MEKIIVTGGNPLRGTVQIGGSKNSALPIIAATLLTSEPCVIRGVPNLSDIQFMCDILRWLSVKATHHKTEGVVEVCAQHPLGVAPYELVRKMRASVCLLGPLLAREGHARVSTPGGCAIGVRPVNLHLAGFEKMGARLEIVYGYVEAEALLEVCQDRLGIEVLA